MCAEPAKAETTGLLLEEDLAFLCDGRNLHASISLEVINRCNVACRMCEGSIEVETFGPKPLYKVSAERARWLVDSMRLDGVTLSGNYSEPLLNREIVGIVEAIGERGGRTHVMTNLTLATPELLGNLVDAGLESLFVSLHGPDAETAEHIMARSDFDKVIGNMEALAEIKRERNISKPYLIIVMVLMRCNIHKVGDMVSLAKRVGGVLHLMPLKGPSSERFNADLSFLEAEEVFSQRGLLDETVKKARAACRAERVQLRLCPSIQHLEEEP